MAELSSRRRSLKAPIHNPYDKFTQPEFDAWIDGITGVLRKALGHEEEEEETAPETATYDEEPSVTPQDDGFREYEETDEGQSETEELDVEKGKARDPREGPGLGSGTIDEPIELESDEEEEGTQQELEGTQDDDGYEEYEEGEEADEDDARTSGWRETGDNQTHYQKNEESEREEEEDEDDWEEREYRRKGKNWTSEEHSRPYENESRSRALPMDHQKDKEYVEDEYEDEYDEEGEYDEYEEGYDEEAEEGPEPIVISEDEEEEENDENVPPVRQFEVKRGPQVATRTQDDDEDEEDGTHERSHLDFEAQHDAETEEDIDGEGVDYDELSEDQLLAGNSDKENIVHEIDESEDYMQHPETHTAFSLNQSDETSEEQPISIRDPWSGPKIFAEDFYSGGDIRLPLDSTLDVNYLNEFDAPSSDIGNFLTPGVMTPSLIGSEGLATPDALLSRTPQHSKDQEETQMVETSGRAYEHHPVESEDALSFAPTGRDQQEVEIIDTEPSDDVFDFGSFHQSSQPSLEQVTISAPAQDPLLQMADSVVKAAVSGLAVQTEAMEDALVETSVYLPIQNDLDIQEFAKDSTPEIIDVDTDELDEFMDGVTGHKADAAPATTVEESESAAVTSPELNVAIASVDQFSVPQDNDVPAEFASTPLVDRAEDPIESIQADHTEDTVPAKTETQTESKADSKDQDPFGGEGVMDTLEDRDPPEHAAPAPSEIQTESKADSKDQDSFGGEGVTDSLEDRDPHEHAAPAPSEGGVQVLIEAPSDVLAVPVPEVVHTDNLDLFEVPAQDEILRPAETSGRDAHLTATQVEVIKESDMFNEGAIHDGSVSVDKPTLGGVDFLMTLLDGREDAVADDLTSVDMSTQSDIQIEPIVPLEDDAEASGGVDSTDAEPFYTSTSPEAQTFELVEHSIAVAVPDTQETTVDTSDFLSYEMSTELGSVVEEVATEPSTTVDTIDPHPSEMTTVLPSVLGEIAAESPIAVVEPEDEDIDELEGDLSYPDESPAPTTIGPGALEGSQVQSFDLISPTVSQEPILSPTEDTESSEQAQAQRDDTPALTLTAAENDNMVATPITGHNPISSPTSVSRPPPVLSADPYPASLSTPLYWTNEIPSSSLPTLPFVSAENSVGPVNPIATHPKSPSKEKKGENGDEDSDAEGDIDPDYVEISGSATSTRSPSPPSAGNTSREPSSLPQPSQDLPAKNTLEFSQENEDAVKALPGPSGSLEASPSPESTERPEADNFDLIQTAEDEGHDKDLVHETPVLTVDPITETDPFKLMGNNSTVAPGAVEVDKQDLDGPQPAEESKDTPTPDSVEQGEKGDDIKGEQPEVSSNITSIPVEKNGTVDGPSKDDGNSTPGVSGSSARSGSNTSTRGSKRKRKSPNLTSVRQNRNLVPQKDSSIRIKSPGKGKGKRKQRQESETPSMSSSGASTAAKMLQPSSRASSVGSSATGGGSTIAHPSPSFAHSKEISFPTPAIPQLMLHSHSRLPRSPYQPIRPSLSLQTQIQTKAPSTTKSSISPNSPDPASSPSRPTPQVSRSASMSSPVSTTRSTRSTRSNCRYHKISLPEEEDDGPHIFFLVPGCSLVDSELIKEEDIQDHGDATYEDSLRKVDDIETLDIHPYVLGVIRQLVGPDKEQDVYFLPKLQEERARKVRHKKRLSKLSSKDYGAYGETHDSNGVLLSPASSRPPVSAAGSTSTSASRRKKGYDADSYSSGEEDDSDPEGEEHAEPPNKKSKTSREENGDSQSNLQTAAAKSSKRVLKRRLGSDAAEYQPGNTDEETEEGSDAEPSRRRKHGKKALNLKRSRTDTQDGRRTKKPKIRTSVWDTSEPLNQYQAQSSVDPDQHTDLQPESH